VVFKRVSSLRFNTEAPYKVVYKPLRKSGKYKPSVERFCTKLCTKLYAELSTKLQISTYKGSMRELHVAKPI